MKRVATVALLSLVVLSATRQIRGQPIPTPDDPLAQNAALAYWQAFAMLPETTDPQGEALDAAIDGKGPITAELATVLEESQGALRELHRGAKRSRCVWGTAFEEGPNALLSHLGRARELAKLAILRARSHFDQGHADQAINDVKAVMTLARHVGSEGLLISILVQYSIERPVIEMTARYLPGLDAAAVRDLERMLGDLPASVTMADAVRLEKQAMLEWFISQLSEPGGMDAVFAIVGNEDNSNVKELRNYSQPELLQAAIALRPIYDKLSLLMELAPADLEKKAEAAAVEPQFKGPVKYLAGLLLPAVIAARTSEAAHDTRLALLKAAIAVVTQGESALKSPSLKDPFGDGPFGYRKVTGGFELQSELVARDGSRVKLAVGGTTVDS